MPHSYNETATSSAASFPRRTAPAASSLPPPTLLGMQQTKYQPVPQRGIHLPHKTAHRYQEFRSKPALGFRVPSCILAAMALLLGISGDFRSVPRFSPLKTLENGVGTAENATREKGVIREPTPAQNSSFFWDRKRRGRGGKRNVYPVRISSAFLRSATEFWVPLFRGGWGGGGYIF